MTDIPQYYQKHMDDAIGRYLAIQGDASWIFSTDFHAHDNTFVCVELMKYLNETTGIKNVFVGGDFPYAFGTEISCLYDTERSVSYLARIKPKMNLYIARGNHDITIRTRMEETEGHTYPKEFTQQLLMSAVSPFTAELTEDMCYYIDDTKNKIRYIVVNTSDSQSSDENKYWGVNSSVGDRQLKWLSQKAFSLPDGGENWAVVTFGHIPCAECIQDYEPPLGDFSALLADFKNKRKSVYADFSSSKADFAAFICGHNHLDRFGYDDGVLHISTGSEAYYHDDVWERKIGTTSETLFDIFTIDKKTRKLYATRIGAGEDRVFDY